MPENKDHVIFVGNIPYGLTTEQIEDILGKAGSLNNFRAVNDKETGKPKGYGFAEFNDRDSAETAVRNLNGYEVMGRNLKVDYTNKEGGGSNENPSATLSPSQAHSLPNGQGAASSNALPMPAGQELPAGVTCQDAISSTLSAIPVPQVLDFLSSMKGVAMTEPGKAAELLSRAPPLAYAIFQALLSLGLVNTEVLTAVVSQAQAPPPQQQPQAPPPMPQPAPSPFGYPPQPQYQHIQLAHTMTPPAPLQYHQPPPPTVMPAAAPQIAANQQETFKKVLTMSQQEVNDLEPELRNQVMQIRAMMGRA